MPRRVATAMERVLAGSMIAIRWSIGSLVAAAIAAWAASVA